VVPLLPSIWRKLHTDPLRMCGKKLIAKKPFKLVAVALANEMARIAFTIMRNKDDLSRGTGVRSVGGVRESNGSADTHQGRRPPFAAEKGRRPDPHP
jgi:hypothetical protein